MTAPSCGASAIAFSSLAARPAPTLSLTSIPVPIRNTWSAPGTKHRVSATDGCRTRRGNFGPPMSAPAVNMAAAMQITELLQRVHVGDQQALHTVIPLVYDELKKLAAGHLWRGRQARALGTTALLHEGFFRLAPGQHPPLKNRGHFFGSASRAMRQILWDPGP